MREILLKGSGVRNWPVPDSMGIQRTKHRGDTVCAKYRVIYSIQNILRILEVTDRNPGPKHKFIPKYQVRPLGHIDTHHFERSTDPKEIFD